MKFHGAHNLDITDAPFVPMHADLARLKLWSLAVPVQLVLENVPGSTIMNLGVAT
jgi:hypothetical protein